MTGPWLLVLASAVACGQTSHENLGNAASAGSQSGPPDSGAGVSSGGAGEAGNAGNGGAGGVAADGAGCSGPLAEWTPIAGDLQTGVGSAAFASEAVLFSSVNTMPPGAIIPIDAQHPATPGTAIPFSAPAPVNVATSNAGRFFTVGEDGTGKAQLSLIGSDGAVHSAPSAVSALALPRSAVAASTDRVVVASGDGSGTFVVDTFDASLKPVGSQQLPHYSFGSVKSTPQGFQLAVVNVVGKSLEVYSLTDTGKSLLRAHPVPVSTVAVAWAGDSLIVNASGLVLISPDDSRVNLDLPAAVATSMNLAWLNATSSPLGLVVGLAIDNHAYVGLIRSGAIEWDGPAETGVFADVRADANSLGAYYVATGRTRTLAYLGRQCPPQ